MASVSTFLVLSLHVLQLGQVLLDSGRDAPAGLILQLELFNGVRDDPRRQHLHRPVGGVAGSSACPARTVRANLLLELVLGESYCVIAPVRYDNDRPRSGGAMGATPQALLKPLKF